MTIYNQISSNRFKTFAIFAIFIFIFSGFFFIIGQYYHNPESYFVIGLIISLFSSVGSYFFSDKIVLSIAGAEPASKEKYFDFYTVAENLAMADGLPMPKLYVIPDESLNAFATGRDPKHAVVCATTGILRKLDRAEIEGVIAHELSHVKNYDILVMTVTAVLVGTIATIADWISRSLWWGRGDDDDRNNRNPLMFLLLIVTLILTPIAATLIQLAISRKREFLADASGALLTRYPEGLARALEKISYDPQVRNASSATAHLYIASPFTQKEKKSSWFLSLFSTHPPIEERIRILREM